MCAKRNFLKFFLKIKKKKKKKKKFSCLESCFVREEEMH